MHFWGMTSMEIMLTIALEEQESKLIFFPSKLKCRDVQRGGTNDTGRNKQQ